MTQNFILQQIDSYFVTRENYVLVLTELMKNKDWEQDFETIAKIYQHFAYCLEDPDRIFHIPHPLSEEIIFCAIVEENYFSIFKNSSLIYIKNKNLLLDSIFHYIYEQNYNTEKLVFCYKALYEQLPQKNHSSNEDMGITYSDLSDRIFISALKNLYRIPPSEHQELFSPFFEYMDNCFLNLNSNFIITQLLRSGSISVLELFKEKGTDFVRFHVEAKNNLTSDISIYGYLVSMSSISEIQAINTTHFLLSEGISFADDNYHSFTQFIVKDYEKYTTAFLPFIDIHHSHIKIFYSQLAIKSTTSIPYSKLNIAEEIFLASYKKILYYHFLNEEIENKNISLSRKNKI